jgi:tetratricopeptide (TPR) repeat protein
MGLQKECVDTLLGLLETAKKDPKTLRWTANAALPSDAKQFIPEAVQGYSAGLYGADSAEATALCHKLCDAEIAAFPEHPFAYNIKAALASAKGDQDETLRYLKLAHSKAPNDALILLNLGDTYQKMGDPAKAKDAYTKVLALENIEEDEKDQAKAGLKQLEKPSEDKAPAKKPEE